MNVEFGGKEITIDRPVNIPCTRDGCGTNLNQVDEAVEYTVPTGEMRRKIRYYCSKDCATAAEL